jgi:cysteine desulfurase
MSHEIIKRWEIETMTVYPDNAATTRVCEEAAQAALAAMTQVYGNPSSTHTLGREAKKMMTAAREQVAAALGCTPREIYFTSGGSESDNWAIRMGAQHMRHHGKHIISSTVEHDAVRKSLDLLEKDGFEVTRLAPEPDGSIAPEAVFHAMRKDTILVTLMMVNNETGGVTDIASIAKSIKRTYPSVLFHTDAVQGYLKIPFSARNLGVDLISISGHKIHAPKGIGALYIRNGLSLPPLIVGGGQEDGKRSGTEPLPAITAFGAASELGKQNMEEAVSRMTALRECAIRRLSMELPNLVWIDGNAPHILCLSLPGYRSEVLMNFLESKEIYVSKGSACKKGRRSHVLEQLGLSSDVIDGAIRVSLSSYTTEAEIDAFCDGLISASRTLFPALR